MKRPKLLFFDVNETLLDLSAMKTSVAQALDGRADLLPLWFTTMLQYSLVASDKGQQTLLSGQEPSRALGVLEYYHLNGTLFSVNGTQQLLWSNLGMLLAEHNMSVLGLHKRLQEKGVSVNLKSLYRLAGSQPLQKFDARIVKPICLVLGVDLSELISLEEPKPSLLKLDPETQARITGLLDKNNQGTITKRERSELERLVDKAEKISLHNARALVEYRRRRADKRERRSGNGTERQLEEGQAREWLLQHCRRRESIDQ